MISALNYLSKKRTSLSLGEDELLAERVRSYPCFYDKTCKEHKDQKHKALKGKQETIISWPIILFKHSMPSPNEKNFAGPAYYMCNKK